MIHWGIITKYNCTLEYPNFKFGEKRIERIFCWECMMETKKHALHREKLVP